MGDIVFSSRYNKANNLVRISATLKSYMDSLISTDEHQLSYLGLSSDREHHKLSLCQRTKDQWNDNLDTSNEMDFET